MNADAPDLARGASQTASDPNANRRHQLKLGIYIYGLATIAAGIMDFVWGDFEAGHQPIQALGDHIPGREILAYVTAAWLATGGAAILWRRTARVGAVALTVIYLVFAIFWLPRFYTAPRILGFRAYVYIGVMGGVAQQLILAAAAANIYAAAAHGLAWQRTTLIIRWIFGLCSVNFGLSHLTGLQPTAAFVPKWMPLGGDFWAIATGICFVLAGLAILSGLLDVPAARLLALMLLVFSALALAPRVFTTPRNHVAWGSNAYNGAAVGAAWLLAGSLERRQRNSGTARS